MTAGLLAPGRVPRRLPGHESSGVWRGVSPVTVAGAAAALEDSLTAFPFRLLAKDRRTKSYAAQPQPSNIGASCEQG